MQQKSIGMSHAVPKQAITGQPLQQTCQHTSLVKEYAYGAATGNFICLQCERLLTSVTPERNN
jgi:hypothetical protein